MYHSLSFYKQLSLDCYSLQCSFQGCNIIKPTCNRSCFPLIHTCHFRTHVSHFPWINASISTCPYFENSGHDQYPSYLTSIIKTDNCYSFFSRTPKVFFSAIFHYQQICLRTVYISGVILTPCIFQSKAQKSAHSIFSRWYSGISWVSSVLE